MTLDTIANWLDVIGFVALVITAIGSTFSAIRLWIDNERQKAKIYIALQTKHQTYTLPTPVRRKDFSRAEVQGRLGTIPIKEPETEPGKQNRYKLKYISDPRFLAEIERIYADNRMQDTLVIPCSDDEYNQFNIA